MHKKRLAWQTKKLGEICNVIPGQSPPGKYYNNTGNGLPFYQGKKEFREKFIGEPTTWTTYITKEAQENDILMSVRAPVGPINFSTGKICIGRGLAAIRTSKLIDKEFLFYFLLKHKNEIIGNSGAVFNSISKTQIDNILISFPPLNEQQRIVAILDKAFAAIDKAKFNAERNLKNAKELFESYLQSVFENKDNDWDEKALGEICKVERGSSPRPIDKYFTDSPDGVNWVKIGDTKNVDKYIYFTRQKITKEGALSSRFVDVDDFILSNSMSFGKPYIMKTQGYIHDGWFVLRLPKIIDTEFFWYLLASPYTMNQFISLAAGAIVKNISSDLVKKTILPIPPLKQQQAIAHKLDILSAETKKLEAIYQAKVNELNQLKKSILQKAFSGELTTENIDIDTQVQT